MEEGCQDRHTEETPKEKPGEAGDERVWTPEDNVSTTTARSVTQLPQLPWGLPLQDWAAQP